MPTTIFVFGEVPDNHLRSFMGAFDITDGNIIRPGADFVEEFQLMLLDNRRDIEEYTGERHDNPVYQALLTTSRDAATRYIQDYFGVTEAAHLIMSSHWEDMDGSWAHRYLISRVYSSFPDMIGWFWTYEPPASGDCHHPAIMTSNAHPTPRKTVETRMEFLAAVQSRRITTTNMDFGPPQSTRLRVVEMVLRERASYPVPMDEDTANRLTGLIRERNRLSEDNSCGFDHDLGPLEEEIHEIYATIG